MTNTPETTAPASPNPFVRVRQLVEHWRTQGDTCADAGRISAATQYRNFADALESTLDTDAVVSIVITVHDSDPHLAVSATGKPGLTGVQVAAALRDALSLVETNDRIERNAKSLADSLT